RVPPRRDDTYIGKMVIDFNGKVEEIDCCPSDAIAIAVRAKHPILVAKKIIDEQLFRQSQDSCDEGSESASEKK
ncbi:MAG: DUF151 domain-containing protein, partial [Candidatus Poribacteria bacterium]|nr:DUF151 domain-containing protein [Candidatus Poribacteria bacterium]